ncbi:isochorismatase family protein [Bradyrhizobium huanghuaihaiense]|uniref:isochorismatase family protein n=1 Tax=Bradyrhizobium huanghuaihaiense TaxID=990078 RepID=UPI0021AA5E4A|nr:isochorismatase family protein [Bradyrhizobium sp. CB3035]UWU80537.1 isochorismatase family protein [Bradyrhizobium sp. CB3035]
MLADPRHSVVVILNPDWPRTGAPEVDAHIENFPLLEAGCRILGVTPLAVGDCKLQTSAARTGQVFQMIPLDGQLLWKDERFVQRMVQDGFRFLYLAGAWLEEDVLITALEGAARGYDIRLLSDLSAARREAERRPMFDRLVLHGMLVTTVRQTLLEWAVCLGDHGLIGEIRQLLK